MKVSVVLATYNGEKYIERQIESILSQSRNPDEIVVSDDGSTDTTMSILEKYRSDYQEISWIFLKNKKSGFVSNFLNGIEHAHGEVIFLSDQDDEWKKNKIETHLAVYNQYPDALLLHGEIDIVDIQGNLLKKGSQGYSDEIKKIEFMDFLHKPNYPGMSISFKQSIFVESSDFFIENFENIHTHDYYLVMIAATRNGLYSIGRSLSDRTFTGKNVALTMNDNNKTNRSKRIESSQININQLTLTIRFLQKYMQDSKKINQTEKILNFQILRKKFLMKKSIINSLKYFFCCLKVGRLKTYFADAVSF